MVTHTMPAMVSITGSVRAGMEVATAAADSRQAGPPGARRQGAGRRVRRRRPRGRGRGHRRRRVLQRRAGLHRGHPGDRRPARLRRLRRRADRAGQGDHAPACPTTPTSLYGPVNNANQLAQVAGFVDRAARPRRGHHRRRTARGDAGFYYAPTVVADLHQDDEIDPERGLRPGHHRAAVQRRGRGAGVGQRRRVRPGLVGLDPEPRPGHADGASGWTSAACGSTPTSRWWRRCRTAASSSPGYGKDLSMYGARGLHAHQARHDQPRTESSSPSSASLRSAPTRFARQCLRSRPARCRQCTGRTRRRCDGC